MSRPITNATSGGAGDPVLTNAPWPNHALPLLARHVVWIAMQNTPLSLRVSSPPPAAALLINISHSPPTHRAVVVWEYLNRCAGFFFHPRPSRTNTTKSVTLPSQPGSVLKQLEVAECPEVADSVTVDARTCP